MASRGMQLLKLSLAKIKNKKTTSEDGPLTAKLVDESDLMPGPQPNESELMPGPQPKFARQVSEFSDISDGGKIYLHMAGMGDDRERISVQEDDGFSTPCDSSSKIWSLLHSSENPMISDSVIPEITHEVSDEGYARGSKSYDNVIGTVLTNGHEENFSDNTAVKSVGYSSILSPVEDVGGSDSEMPATASDESDMDDNYACASTLFDHNSESTTTIIGEGDATEGDIALSSVDHSEMIDSDDERRLPVSLPGTSGTIHQGSNFEPHGQMGTSSSPIKNKGKLTMKKCESRKKARQAGKSYSAADGRYVSEKKFCFAVCHCRYKCSDNLPKEDREDLFKHFWGLSSWQCQSNFILSCIDVSPPKRTTVQNSRKSYTRTYTLNNQRICKDVFLKTLAISNGRVDYCINRKSVSSMCSPDKRGKNYSNKTSLAKIKSIQDFLNSIPKYSSHYSTSSKVYFSPDLNKPKLYELYKENNTNNFVSLPIFNKYFDEYNIGFYVPRTDTCKTCDQLEIESKSADESTKLELAQQLKEHHSRAERARDSLRKASEESKKDPSVLVFTFDMQQTAPLPRINTSVVFYKRQLWVYNVGIHTCHDSAGIMMMWTEGDAKRGSVEVCSSILEFLKSLDLKKYKKIITFSDACGGQNRNKAIICLFMYVCSFYGVSTWEHRYLESGHSYLPNDRDFGIIGKKAKNVCTVYNLDQWMDVVKTARKKSPFKVINMDGKFKDIESLTASRKFNALLTDADTKFNFLKLKYFKVEKDSSVVQYEESGSDEIHNFNYYPLVSGLQLGELTECDRRHKISAEKYKDLLTLLPFIPDNYKSFYTNLQHE